MSATRWHTEGRRQPVLIGKDASGRRIPGGPYVVWQLAALPLFPTLWHFRTSWAGGHSSFGALVLTLAVTAGVFVAIGRVDFAGRNPLLVLIGAVAGVVGAHTAARGRLGGAALRTPPTRRPRHRSAAALHSQAAPPAARPSAPAALTLETRPSPGGPVQPEAPQLTTSQPDPRQAPSTPAPAPARPAGPPPPTARLSPLESFLQAAGKV